MNKDRDDSATAGFVATIIVITAAFAFTAIWLRDIGGEVSALHNSMNTLSERIK